MTSTTLTYIHTLLKEDLASKEASHAAAWGNLHQYLVDTIPFELDGPPYNFDYLVKFQLKAGPERDKSLELKAIYDEAAKARWESEDALWQFEHEYPSVDWN